MDTNPALDKIKDLLNSAGTISEEKAKEVLKAIGSDEITKASNTGKKQPALPASKGTAEKSETNEGTLPPWLKKGKKKDEDESDEDESEDESEDDTKEDDEDEEASDEDDSDEKDSKKVKKEAFDVQTHMNALFADEASLTEDFKNKAVTIFEAALNERVEALREEVAAEYEDFIAEELENNKLQIVEQLNQYLEYIAENWIEENRLAVENGIKNEITESFIEGLRDLFLNHGIEVPETDTDVVDDLSGRIEELEEALNAEIEKNIELSSSINEQAKASIIQSLGEDLNDVQFDKFVQLAENISYETDEDLVEKLETIKESYFSGKSQPASKKEDDLTPDESASSRPEVMSESVDQIINEISRRLV
jgi:hypothetical protein